MMAHVTTYPEEAISDRAVVHRDPFEMRARGTTVSREILAGITTFGAVSYILAVNPAVLSAAGISVPQLVAVTAISAAIGSLIMGLWSNLPIALAPTMGANVIFAQVVVVGMKLPFQTALAVVLVNSVIFLLIAGCGVRQYLVREFPRPLRIGAQCAFGIFLAWLGLKNSGLIDIRPGSLAFASLSSPANAFALAALVGTAVMFALRVPAALFVSIVVITMVGLVVPAGNGGAVTQLPKAMIAAPALPTQTFMAFDLMGLARHIVVVLPVLIYMCINDFFGNTFTLMSVLGGTGLKKEGDELPGGFAALASDGVASFIGAILGTSSVGAFAESAAGIAAGGRTGLTAVTVAVLMLFSIWLWPLVAAIPPQATGPALVIVGMLMQEGLRELDFDRVEETFPAFASLIVCACTTDIVISLAIGTFLYTILVFWKAGWRAISPVLIGLNVVFSLFVVLAPKG